MSAFQLIFALLQFSWLLGVDTERSLSPGLIFGQTSRVDILGNDITLTSSHDQITFPIPGQSQPGCSGGVGETQNWIIDADASVSRYLMVFESLNIGSAELKVQDINEGEDAQTFFECIDDYCNILPPAFESSGAKIVVQYREKCDINFKSSAFTLSYYSVLASSDNTVNALVSNTVSLKMPYGHLRPFVTNDGVMPAGFTTTWTISNNLVGGLYPRIELSFSRFNFSSCDVGLVVTSGINTLHEGCTQPDTWMATDKGAITVTFTGHASLDIRADFMITWRWDEKTFACGMKDLATDILKDESMFLTDGTNPTGVMEITKGGPCTWLISPSSISGGSGSVTLFFSRVYIKANSWVRVYDGLTTNPNLLLWDGYLTFDNFMTPPPIISSSPSLYVEYVSGSATACSDCRGFRGEFMVNSPWSRGIGSRRATIGSSSALTLRNPGDGSSYVAGMDHIWEIIPRATGSIVFSFSKLDLPVDCSDNVTIYDGVTTSAPILGTFCGSSIQRTWTLTSNPQALIRFISSPYSSSKGGFQLAYYSDGGNYNCGNLRNSVGQMTLHSFILTDGSASGSAVLGGANCLWDVEPNEAQSIYIFFDRMSISKSFVEVFVVDGNEYTLFKNFTANSIGEGVPAPLLIPYPKVQVRYQSKSTAKGKGWSLTYFGVTPSASGPGAGNINLRSGIVHSLLLPLDRSIDAVINKNVSWDLAPIGLAVGEPIFIVITNFSSLVDCKNSYLEIFDGTGASLTNVGRFCRNRVPSQWITLSNTEGMLNFVAPMNATLDDHFDLSYFSDATTAHCGMATVPAILRATSMFFSDGSKASDPMNRDLLCEWLIEPSVVAPIAVEFLNDEIDLTGGFLELYDNDNSTVDNLLFRCDGCKVKPPVLLARSGRIVVKLVTKSVFTIGTGFRAIYSVVSSPSLAVAPSDTKILEMPTGVTIDRTTLNETASWQILVPNGETLSLVSDNALSAQTTASATFLDGRPNGTSFSRYIDVTNFGAVCGRVSASAHPVLHSPTLSLQSTQTSSEYVRTRAAGSTATKDLLSLSYTADGTPGSAGTFSPPASACKYQLISGSEHAIAITVNRFNGRKGKNKLLIVGGLLGNDTGTAASATLIARTLDITAPLSVIAPCGQSLILVVPTDEDETQYDPAELDISFSLYPGDEIFNQCFLYRESLKPKPPPSNHLFYIMIAGGVLFFLIVLIFAVVYIRRHWNDPPKHRKKYKVINPHPSFTPRFDAFANKFLRKGQCCICQEPALPVIQIKCLHKICIDCLKGYLISALGDISMFPVKCPMHYEGCSGQITASISKRILVKSQYERFLDFSDRALYGEGMRCIYCNNYVNFPLEGGLAMVECPYCVQRFCMRCRKPWHYGGSCPLESVDNSLDIWRAQSGASTCPVCKKLIEKEDADTCHHMVHKITDGIPCIRDRTDFCYLCGYEVKGDYPHDEIKNPGVNHFPDGVFQDCRVVKTRRKDAERDRLRKARRASRRNSSASGGMQSPNRARIAVTSAASETDATGTIAGNMLEQWEEESEVKAPTTAADILWEREERQMLQSSPQHSPPRSTPTSGSPSPTRGTSQRTPVGSPVQQQRRHTGALTPLGSPERDRARSAISSPLQRTTPSRSRVVPSG
jgi:hypothetical protein